WMERGKTIITWDSLLDKIKKGIGPRGVKQTKPEETGLNTNPNITTSASGSMPNWTSWDSSIKNSPTFQVSTFQPGNPQQQWLSQNQNTAGGIDYNKIGSGF